MTQNSFNSVPNSRSCSALKQLGDAAFQRQAFADAVEAYSGALARLQGSPEDDPSLRGALHANRCLARLKVGDRDAAAAALEDAREACRLRPRWGKAHLRLAQAQEACGQPRAAAASYQRAAELDGELAAAACKALAALERREARKRCLLVLQGHQGPIYDAFMHPQALQLGSVSTRLVVTAGADASVRVWCSITGCQLAKLEGHDGAVTRLCLSPCGCILASASVDGTARLWHLQAHTQQPFCGVCSLHSCNGGAHPAASSQLLAPGPVLSGHSGRVSCLAFSPDSSLLATGSGEGQVWVWKPADGSCTRQLGSHGGLVTAVCFSPCGQLLASASGDGVCRVVDPLSGNCVADIAWDSGPVNHCSFVLPCAPLTPMPSNGACGREHQQQPASAAAATAAAAAAGDSWAEHRLPTRAQGQPAALLLTCHVKQQWREGRILLWDVLQRRHGWVDGKLCGPAASLDGFRGKVTCADNWVRGSSCCRSRSSGDSDEDGSSAALLAAACNDGSVQVFDLESLAANVGTPSPPGSACGRSAAAATLLELTLPHAGTASGTAASSWQSAEPAWSSLCTQQAQHDRNLVALSPDGQRLAAVGPDCRILVLDLEGSQRQLALPATGPASAAGAAGPGPVRALRWLSPSRLLSAGEDRVARLWDVSMEAA